MFLINKTCDKQNSVHRFILNCLIIPFLGKFTTHTFLWRRKYRHKHIILKSRFSEYKIGLIGNRSWDKKYVRITTATRHIDVSSAMCFSGGARQFPAGRSLAPSGFRTHILFGERELHLYGLDDLPAFFYADGTWLCVTLISNVGCGLNKSFEFVKGD